MFSVETEGAFPYSQIFAWGGGNSLPLLDVANVVAGILCDITSVLFDNPLPPSMVSHCG